MCEGGVLGRGRLTQRSKPFVRTNQVPEAWEPVPEPPAVVQEHPGEGGQQWRLRGAVVRELWLRALRRVRWACEGRLLLHVDGAF